MNNNNNYYNKYLKYKNKYSQLKLTNTNKKGGANKGKILYENIIGDIDPNLNLITLIPDLESVPISDHYLLLKSIKLDGQKKINLFNINISKLYQFKTKIKNNLFFNTMRSEKNLQFAYANKQQIIDMILQISKDNIDLLKNENVKKIKSIFVKKMTDLIDLTDLVNLTDLKINIVKIIPTEAKIHIVNNLNLDPDTNFYYTFDIEFNKESLKEYKERLQKFFTILTDNIQLLGDLIHDDYLVINIQELSPLDKILYLFNDFIKEIETNLGIELKLIYVNTIPINSSDTYSLSIVSTNTNYSLDNNIQSKSESESKSELNQDDILEYIINQKKNIMGKNFKMISSDNSLPPIYNFHTGMFYNNDFTEFINHINNPCKFIISGDLNLKLDSSDSISCVRKITKSKKIKVEFCSTPESNYPINNYTYDVIMYRL